MSVYGQVLAWSQPRPLWQRDALRRIAENGGLTEADVSELVELCLAEAAGSISTGARPLGAEHLPVSASSSEAVKLDSVTHTGGVNRLAPGALLPFTTTGLTVVYGRNGTGKSGYGRILKQVCRARGRKPDILPNALDPSAGSLTPAATVAYRCGDRELSFEWKQGEAAPDELSRVSVFDAHSAKAHLDGDVHVAYLPAGLDLLQELVGGCARVEQRLQDQLSTLEATRWVPPSDLTGSKVVGGFVAQLGKDGILELLLRFAEVNEAQRQRLREIDGQLAILKENDPEKVISQKRLTARRLRAAADKLQRLLDGLQDDALRRVVVLRDEARTTRQAADLARRSLAEEPLPEVGGHVWRQLWESARAYSTQVAYIGREHPHTQADARCILCQQTLSPEAGDRLKRFEAFVSGHSQKAATDAEAALAAKLRTIELLPLQSSDTDDEFNALQESLGDHFKEAVEVARQRSALATQLLEAIDPKGQIAEAPTWPSLQPEDLIALAAAEDKGAEELHQARNPEARRLLEEERLELAALIALHREKAQVEREHHRRRQEKVCTKARSSCATKGITTKQSELTAEVVTNTLCETFKDELSTLGGDRIPAVLQPAPGQRGVPQQRVSLRGGPDAKVADVLSEGELRVVALAGFLTDLAATEDLSTLVFDDPVSSLDADFREKVAARLVLEAERRQVIVFTHDLAFLAYLVEQSDAKEQDLTYYELGWAAGSSGSVTDDLPPDGTSVERRIRAIRHRNGKSRRYYDDGPAREDAKWRGEAGWMATQLRKAWERAVETHLLNGAVQRHSRSVQTQRVSKIRVRPEDTAALDAAMDVLSGWGPHEGSAEMNLPAPRPSDIERAIATLEAWCLQVDPKTRPKQSVDLALAQQTPSTVTTA